MGSPIQAAAYYFPNYHPGDPRNDAWHGAGWTEWELVKRAEPRFPGPPPAASPALGLRGRIGPAGDGAEDRRGRRPRASTPSSSTGTGTRTVRSWSAAWTRASCRRANNSRLQVRPHVGQPRLGRHPSGQRGTTAAAPVPGRGHAEGLLRGMADHMIARLLPAPVLLADRRQALLLRSTTDRRLVEGFGSVEATRDGAGAISRERSEGGRACRDLHLNAVVWGEQILPGEKQPADVNELLATRSASTRVTSYVWIHHVPLQRLPDGPLRGVSRRVRGGFRQRSADQLPAALFPERHHGLGLQPADRPVRRATKTLGYPFMPDPGGQHPGGVREGAARREGVPRRRPHEPAPCSRSTPGTSGRRAATWSRTRCTGPVTWARSGASCARPRPRRLRDPAGPRPRRRRARGARPDATRLQRQSPDAGPPAPRPGDRHPSRAAGTPPRGHRGPAWRGGSDLPGAGSQGNGGCPVA